MVNIKSILEIISRKKIIRIGKNYPKEEKI